LENVVVSAFKVVQCDKELAGAAVVCMKSAVVKPVTINNKGKVSRAVPVGER